MQEGAGRTLEMSDPRDASPSQTAANPEGPFVDADIDNDAACTSQARLLVHVDLAGRMNSFRSVLRRLCGAHLEAPRVQWPMRVQVADLRGDVLRRVDTYAPLAEIPLPPGTYHVTVTLGNICRRYTTTLASGASCDLHLRPARGAA
jgi:hypothetical protein